MVLAYWWCTIPIGLEMDRISPSLHTSEDYNPERVGNLTIITQHISHRSSVTMWMSEAPRPLTAHWGTSPGWELSHLTPTGWMPILNDHGHNMLSDPGPHGVTYKVRSRKLAKWRESSPWRSPVSYVSPASKKMRGKVGFFLQFLK